MWHACQHLWKLLASKLTLFCIVKAEKGTNGLTIHLSMLLNTTYEAVSLGPAATGDIYFGFKIFDTISKLKFQINEYGKGIPDSSSDDQKMYSLISEQRDQVNLSSNSTYIEMAD